jgi:hypothetical protein
MHAYKHCPILIYSNKQILAAAAKRQTDNQAWDPAESQLTKKAFLYYSAASQIIR